MNILIGIITYKRHNVLVECVKRTKAMLDKHDCNASYVFVANDMDSTLGEKLEFVERKHIIIPDKNTGVAGGRNLIIRYANECGLYDHILFIDDDAYLETVPNFEQLCKSSIYACTSFDANGYCRAEDLPPGFKLGCLGISKIVPVGTFIGVAHIMGKEIVQKFSYDEITSYGFEEFNLSFRARSFGHEIYVISNFKVIHLKDPNGRIDKKKVAENRLKSKIYLALTFYTPIIGYVNITFNIMLAFYRGISLTQIFKLIAEAKRNVTSIPMKRRVLLMKRLRQLNFPILR